MQMKSIRHHRGRNRAAIAAAAMGLGLLNLGAAIQDDLVVHLTFDNSLTDRSGRSNNGTAVGSPTFVEGRVGSHAVALSSARDGSSFNYVTLGSPAALNFGTSTDFTISFWARFKSWTFDPPFIGNKNWLSGNNPGWMIATGTDGRLQWNMGGSPGLRKDYDGPAGTVSDGNWHHIAATFLRAGEVITYIDGKEVDVRDVTASLNNIDTPAGFATNIGQDGTGRYTDGGNVGISDLAMDDLGIWRRALTPDEISRIFTAGSGGAPLSTVVSSPVPPTLKSPVQPVATTAGTDLSIKAIPRGSSPFTYQWNRNGAAIQGATNAILNLQDVQSTQAGNYTLTIRNTVGSFTSEPAEVSVDTTQPPVFTLSPANVGAALGGAARFRSSARGVNPITYQWKANGQPLGGATNAELVLSRIKPADAGKYSVTATAGNGQSTTSPEILLSIVNDLRQDLVAHLTFDSDYSDTSGRGNHGSAVGAPKLVEGRIGSKALGFSTKKDGSSFNYVTLGTPRDLDFGFDADYSISFWVRIGKFSRDPVLIANKSWEGSGSRVGYALALGADGRFQWNFKEQVGERADYDTAGGVLSDSQWHHVAVSFQRGGQALTWIDGKLVDSQSLPTSGTLIETGLPLNIGQDGSGTYTENGNAEIEDGTMDDVAIWRRAISNEEVLTIFNKGQILGANVQQQSITDNLVLHLPFDADFQDQSGRNNHGRVVGSPTLEPGKIGSRALAFRNLKDGTSFNYVSLGSIQDLNFGSDSDFSVSFWTRFSQWSGDPAFIGNKNWASGGNQGWIIATAGDGRLQWNLGDGDAGGRTRKDYDGPGGALGNGAWHHVAVTFDQQGNALTYLDGALVNTTVISADLDSLDTPAGLSVNIGQDGTGTYTDNKSVGIEDGRIDDVAVWSRVLGAAEITTIYKGGLEGKDILGRIASSPPIIQAALAAGQITLNWNNSGGPFTLESTSTLGSRANWQAVSGAGDGTAKIPANATAQFFRLRK